jgi:hypothetical protein
MVAVAEEHLRKTGLTVALGVELAAELYQIHHSLWVLLVQETRHQQAHRKVIMEAGLLQRTNPLRFQRVEAAAGQVLQERQQQIQSEGPEGMGLLQQLVVHQ